MYPELQKFQTIDQFIQLEAANFGTGMGYYDFCYDAMETRAFNFALPQQSLEMDYRLMNHYQDHFQKGCRMCIVLPYFIFSAHRFPQVDAINERYYSLLPEQEVRPLCLSDYTDYERRKQKQSLKEQQERLELLKPVGMTELQRQTAEALQNWMQTLKIPSFASGEVSAYIREQMKITTGWLKQILNFCKENEFIPIIVVPPLSTVLLEQLSQSFQDAYFYQVLEPLLSREIMVLDYTKMPEFCEPSLYGWPGFLARPAAIKFTKDVLSKIL